MVLPDFTTQDATTYKANIDATAAEHDAKISFRGCKVYLDAAQAVTTGSTGETINFDQEDYDTDSIHDNATNNDRLVVPSGVTKVRISACLDVDTTTSGTYRIGRIMMNTETTPIAGGETPIHTAADSYINMTTGVVSVVSSDYFTVFFAHDKGSDVSILGGSDVDNVATWFSMEIIE